jgi:DNA polymerase-3 subunit delta
MAALTFDALLRGLKKGAPYPVYLLHGEEDVLKDEAVRALLDRTIDPAMRDFNVDVRAAGDLDPEALHALVDTPPMLAERRAVVLRGVEQLRKKSKALGELLRYLAHPNPSTLLVLVLSGDAEPDADLAAHATTVAVGRLAPERVPGWIAHRAGQLGLTLTPDAVSLLIAAVGGGNDLAALSQELDKLSALTAGVGEVGGRTATAEDVTAAVGVRRGETLDDLVQAALERRAARAAPLVAPVLEQAGMSGVRIVTALGTALVGTALARAELDRGLPRPRAQDAMFQHLLAARPFGLGNYKDVAARWIRWADAWKAGELSRALRAALAADRALKETTVTDDRGIVLELVLGFVVRREVAA